MTWPRGVFPAVLLFGWSIGALAAPCEGSAPICLPSDSFCTDVARQIRDCIQQSEAGPVCTMATAPEDTCPYNEASNLRWPSDPVIGGDDQPWLWSFKGSVQGEAGVEDDGGVQRKRRRCSTNEHAEAVIEVVRAPSEDTKGQRAHCYLPVAYDMCAKSVDVVQVADDTFHDVGAHAPVEVAWEPVEPRMPWDDARGPTVRVRIHGFFQQPWLRVHYAWKAGEDCRKPPFHPDQSGGADALLVEEGIHEAAIPFPPSEGEGECRTLFLTSVEAPLRVSGIEPHFERLPVQLVRLRFQGRHVRWYVVLEALEVVALALALLAFAPVLQRSKERRLLSPGGSSGGSKQESGHPGAAAAQPSVQLPPAEIRARQRAKGAIEEARRALKGAVDAADGATRGPSEQARQESMLIDLDKELEEAADTIKWEMEGCVWPSGWPTKLRKCRIAILTVRDLFGDPSKSTNAKACSRAAEALRAGLEHALQRARRSDIASLQHLPLMSALAIGVLAKCWAYWSGRLPLWAEGMVVTAIWVVGYYVWIVSNLSMGRSRLRWPRAA